MNPSLLQITKHICFNSKDPIYPCFEQKTMDIQSKPKTDMYPWMNHNEYPSFSRFINNNQSQFCHTIKLKQIYITLNDGIVRIDHKTMQTFNGKASSSTLVEDLTFHDKTNDNETKILH